MSDKIKPHHLARKALLYVRQSSTHQVLHNRESQALQYAMRDRLVALGLSEVDTVDDDGDPMHLSPQFDLGVLRADPLRGGRRQYGCLGADSIRGVGG
jgi:hypothetical protein